MKLTARLFLILIITLIFNNNSYCDNIENDICVSETRRQTKSYLDETAFAEYYYDAALKGELKRKIKEPFLFSSLKKIGGKQRGMHQGDFYEDLNKNIWYVKYIGRPSIIEYLGSKVMNLLIGPQSPEMKLFVDTECIASKILPNFLMKLDVAKNRNKKPIVGEADLSIAMDLMGLDDRHDGNLGYIEMCDKLEAARVDFDDSFHFNDDVENIYTESIIQSMHDLKGLASAIKRIYNIPDEMILYVLGEAYNDLWEHDIAVNYEIFEDLGRTLISRKHALKHALERINEIEIFRNKAQKSLSLYTEEDRNQLNQSIEILFKTSLLHWTAGVGDVNLLVLEINNINNINILDEWGNTPLHYAAKNGHLDTIQILVNNNADVNAKNNQDCTPLLYAVERDDIDIVGFLINNGADVNAKGNLSSKNEQATYDGPLHVAAKHGKLNIIHLLVNKGVDINAGNRDGETALHIAARHGDLNIIHFLVDKGADVNVHSHTPYRPIHLAVARGHFDIVNFLIDKDVSLTHFLADFDFKINAIKGPDLLHLALGKGHIDIALFLHEKYYSLDPTTSNWLFGKYLSIYSLVYSR